VRVTDKHKVVGGEMGTKSTASFAEDVTEAIELARERDKVLTLQQ
jgi:hypothetical protein